MDVKDLTGVTGEVKGHFNATEHIGSGKGQANLEVVKELARVGHLHHYEIAIVNHGHGKIGHRRSNGKDITGSRSFHRQFGPVEIGIVALYISNQVDGL